MKLTLDKKWQDKLAGLPEDGMGYQRVTMIFADGGVLNDVLVVNGQECELPDKDASREIKDIQTTKIRRKKLDDDLLSLPKPVHVETLMSSGKDMILRARLNHLIGHLRRGSLGVLGYRMKDIIDDVDDGSKRRSRGCGSSLSKFDKKNGVAEFSSVCHKGSHKQRVTFSDWPTIVELATEDEETDFDSLEGTALFRDPTVGDLLKESDVIVFCSCPSYKFSFAYLCYTLEMGELGEAHDTPPNIRNPNYSGTVCKHLISVYEHYFK